MIRKTFILTLLIGLIFCLFIAALFQSSYAQKKPAESKKSTSTKKEPAKSIPEVKKPAAVSKETEHRWVNIFPIGIEIDSLAVDPQDANTLYASIDRGEGRRGLFKSVNGGNLWFPIGSLKTDKEIANSIVRVDPTNGKIVYFGWGSVKYMGGGYYGELSRSKDGGMHWENISAGVIKAVNNIAIDPKNQEIIYVASNRLYKTLNGGKTWG
mgnify:CR=1 FL=1